MRISVVTPSIRPEGLKVTQMCLQGQSFTDFEWLVDIGIPPKHDLNASYNRMLRRAQGTLIVSLQDYIKVPPDYLQRMWSAHILNPDTFITAPVGKVNNLDFDPPARWDWRAYEDAKPDWKCWEIDSGAAPKEALYAVGGFDEELDKWWSFDNYSVGRRAHLAGYKFMNLFSNPAIAYDHDAFIKHPFRERFRPALVNLRVDEYEENYKLPYLD